MTFKTRLTTAIATGAVLLQALAPISLAQSIDITGNGANSTSGVDVHNSQTTTVNQVNNANISNNVSSSSTTGGNTADFNTNGNNTIITGNATNNVHVSTAVNLNKATVTPCACNQGADVNISGNGAFSGNSVDVSNGSKVSRDANVAISQNNNANVSNNIDAKSSTGKNDSGFNSGGSTFIVTGDAATNVTVGNAANANIAQVGGGTGTGNGSSASIIGNGALSDNSVDLRDNSSVVVDQNNNARVSNNVDSDAKTGKNTADFNVGGKTTIATGNANSNVGVNNLVNFNSADVADCGCFEGLNVKVAGNGAKSNNDVDTHNNSGLWVFGDNLAGLNNHVDGNVQTGLNDAGFGTGHVDGDPVIWTGNSNSTTDVQNTGNVNMFNQGVTTHSLPDNFAFNFDLSGLWAMFNGMN